MKIEQYYKIKQQIIRQEVRVLMALGYNVSVNSPHKIIYFYLRLLDIHSNIALVQSAWNYMNDCLRSPVIFSCHQPEKIACACICLAARNQFLPLPTENHWFELFDATADEILDIIKSLFKLYESNYEEFNYDELESDIVNLKTSKPKSLSPKTPTNHLLSPSQSSDEKKVLMSHSDKNKESEM